MKHDTLIINLFGGPSSGKSTTAAGLFVSVPSNLFYNCFVASVNKNIAKMESLSSDIMIRLSGRGKLL